MMCFDFSPQTVLLSVSLKTFSSSSTSSNPPCSSVKLPHATGTLQPVYEGPVLISLEKTKMGAAQGSTLSGEPLKEILEEPHGHKSI